MSGLHRLSAVGLSLAACGLYDPWLERRIYPNDLGEQGRIIFGKPAKATFLSDKPLTKRQRRRMRGRAKGAAQ